MTNKKIDKQIVETVFNNNIINSSDASSFSWKIGCICKDLFLDTKMQVYDYIRYIRDELIKQEWFEKFESEDIGITKIYYNLNKNGKMYFIFKISHIHRQYSERIYLTILYDINSQEILLNNLLTNTYWYSLDKECLDVIEF